ncbi:hypothetical protein TKK_0006639 [Trichogramma kaykai]
MSTLAKFCAIVVALCGLVLLVSVSPASAYRTYISFERDIGENFLVYGPGSHENTTLYYGICDRAVNQTQKGIDRASYAGEFLQAEGGRVQNHAALRVRRLHRDGSHSDPSFGQG